MAGRQLGTLLDGLLKERQRLTELLLLQRVHALSDKHFRLRLARAEIVQLRELFQLLLRGDCLALSAQGDTQVVARLFEVRLQFDAPPKSSDPAARVAVALELHAD